MVAAILLAAITIPAGHSFPCTPTRVWDGDGPIWCAEGPRIRLAGIAAREIDETCRPNQPCPKATGHEARAALVRQLGGAVGTTSDGHVLVSGPRLTCRSLGPDNYHRTVAWCAAPKTGDLSCDQLRAGVVLRWPRYHGDRVCRQ